MKKEGIQVVELSAERIAQLLDHAKAVFSEEDYRALDNLVSSFFLFRDLLRDEKMTVKQLRKLIFGPKTEKLSKIIEKMEKDGEGPTAASDGTGAPAEVTAEVDEKIQQGDSAAETKRKGHGRNGADAYEGAEVVVIDHESLKPRDPCPEPGCTGRLYQLAQPKVLVRVAGQAPLGAKVIELQQLRCNLCLKVFTAKEPEGLGEEKYDETAGSMIGLLRYGTGVPFNRLEGLQDNLGIPLPTSTQWDIVERAARRIAPAYAELTREAAQGDVLHNDDTPMKILALMEKKEKGDDG